MPNIENYTDAQLNALQDAKENAERAMRTLVIDANIALESIVKLPHTNEVGQPVVHGCNKRMSYIATSLLAAAREIGRGVLPPKRYDELQQEFKDTFRIDIERCERVR